MAYNHIKVYYIKYFLLQVITSNIPDAITTKNKHLFLLSLSTCRITLLSHNISF